jgi:hypothetical protein
MRRAQPGRRPGLLPAGNHALEFLRTSEGTTRDTAVAAAGGTACVAWDEEGAQGQDIMLRCANEF